MRGEPVLSAAVLAQGGSSSEAAGLGGRHAILEFARYFIASAGALAVDVGLYRFALSLGWGYQFAALLGFCAGAVAAYLASVRWVFRARAVRNARLEFGLFVAVGVAGLLLTELVLWLAIGKLRLPALLSKLGTSAVVFAFNFTVRKALLFSARRRQGS